MDSNLDDDLKLEHIFKLITSAYYMMLEPYLDKERINKICRKQNSLLNILNLHLQYSITDFVGIWIYFKRLLMTPTDNYITDKNFSYILLTLVMLYSKMYHDDVWENTYYAKIGTVPIEILNWTEMRIFQTLESHMLITRNEHDTVLSDVNNSIYLV